MTRAAARETPGRDRTAVLAAAAITGLALLLRLAAARGELWLDEIMSLALATGVPEAADLVVRVHHDNNHVLNSLWMRALGRDAAPLLHRLPGVVAGTLAVALLVAWRYRAGMREALVAGALGAACLPLVQCGSEARGYGIALAAALGSVLLARRAESGFSWAVAAAYWLIAWLGLLAHLSSVFILAGLAAAAIVRAARGDVRAPAAMLLRVHAVPILLLLVTWAGTVRDLIVAGGLPPGIPAPVAALSHLVAGPNEGAVAWIAAACAAAAVAAGLLLLRRRRDPDALIVTLASFVVPAAVVLVTRPEQLAPRYFLLPAILALAPLATLLSVGLGASRRAIRLAAGAALAAILAAHLAAGVRLAIVGRGDGIAALDVIAEAAAGRPEVRVGADNDFRLSVLLWRRQGLSRPPPAIRPVPGRLSESDPPEWLLTEEFRPGRELPREVTIRGGARYELVRAFPHSGVTGITWGAYRRRDP